MGRWDNEAALVERLNTERAAAIMPEPAWSQERILWLRNRYDEETVAFKAFLKSDGESAMRLLAALCVLTGRNVMVHIFNQDDHCLVLTAHGLRWQDRISGEFQKYNDAGVIMFVNNHPNTSIVERIVNQLESVRRICMQVT